MATRKEQSEPTFEAGMTRLEEIVREMESGKLPLEELLRRYEEGVKWVAVCGEKLDAAEKRIQTITRDAAGRPVATDTPVTGEAPQPTPAQDEVSLF